MAVFTRGNYNCACSREVCDWTCTTYVTMTSRLVPNTVSQPFKILSKPFKSNADRIRSISDEELAEELWAWNQVCCYKWTKDKILNWLKEEVKGDTDEDQT